MSISISTRQIVKLSIISGFLLLLVGCGATGVVKDVFTTITKADITLSTSENVNPDMNGRPSPVRLFIYELKSTTAFNNADFFSLYDSSIAALGTELVNREDLELKPGETREISREFGAETRFLGIIAAYRNIDTSTWKRVIEIESDSNSDILIELTDSGVNVKKQ